MGGTLFCDGERAADEPRRYTRTETVVEDRCMAGFERVLTRNVGVENSQRLKVYESRGGYQAGRKRLEDVPRRRRRGGEEGQSSRSRRGGVPGGNEMELSAKGPDPDAALRQRRRVGAADVLQSGSDGA